LDSITEPIALNRSAWGRRTWVKPQHCALAFQIGFGDKDTLRIQRSKRRALSTNLKLGWGTFEKALKKSA
jgi:hypothetical protein